MVRELLKVTVLENGRIGTRCLTVPIVRYSIHSNKAPSFYFQMNYGITICLITL